VYFNHLETGGTTELSEQVLQQFTPPILLSNGTVVDAAFSQTATSAKTNRNLIDIVPISLRYNLNNFIGLGTGPQLSLLMNETLESDYSKKYYEVNFGQNPLTPGNEITSMAETNASKSSMKSFRKAQASIFADVTFGFARIGPSLGIRYYKNFEKHLTIGNSMLFGSFNLCKNTSFYSIHTITVFSK